jgi:pimeloyl-ACP methyl ester carboxylesterase
MTEPLSTHAEERSVAQYLLPCRSVSLNVYRIPAKGRPGFPVALFLPGVMAYPPLTCHWVMPLTERFDVIVGALPGHGASGEVLSVTLFDFAMEYAALLDRYVRTPRAIQVVGESFGGLIALALARLRPERFGSLLLLDTPFQLTPPPIAPLLGQLWRTNPSVYHRRILLEICGFDPASDVTHFTISLLPMATAIKVPCAMLAGNQASASTMALPPSMVSDADLAALHQANPAIKILPRLQHAGHCALVEDPAGCLAALTDMVDD